MDIIKLPFIAVGYFAKAMFALYIAVRFTFAWLILFGCFFGLFYLIAKGTGSLIPAILLYAPFAIGGFILWKHDN